MVGLKMRLRWLLHEVMMSRMVGMLLRVLKMLLVLLLMMGRLVVRRRT